MRSFTYKESGRAYGDEVNSRKDKQQRLPWKKQRKCV